MRTRSLILCLATLFGVASARAATLYVNAASTNPVPPYAGWPTAAASIQDAVDAALAGDEIVVTNGVYQTGSREIYGMSNRVAVTRPVTVQSVNGPAYTSIVGYRGPGPTNGPSAIRCVYLTNGAVLAGFTLTNGATSSYGGGVWCESDSAVVSNCALLGNSAGYHGGGAYFGTLNHCVLAGNSASGYGGGANGGTLNHCTLTGNSASQSGGGTYYSTLANCIVYDNTARAGGDNYAGGTLNYCCTTPLPANGAGNISAEPQLAGNWHLRPTSPCRGAGSAASTSGVDLDGEPYANPPSIGCDEYWSGSVTGALSVAIVSSHTYVTPAFVVNFQAVIGGRVSASRWDFGDGTVTGNRLVVSHAWAVPGDYVVELRAYNETYPAGVAATVTVRVLAPPVHYVSAASANPVPPYTSWATAATRIQDAVDAAVPSAVILVSNGVYQTGARAVYGMSNRVAVTKPVTVRSVNGPGVTSIEGSRPIGAKAVRCVYLTNGAMLAGFTLTNGATQSYGNSSESGGGVSCEGPGAVVSNCVFTGNAAYFYGGGAYQGTLNNCSFTGNSAGHGGGASSGTLNNCTLVGNSAVNGGGVLWATLNNCTLTGNTAWAGGGAYSSTLNNCVFTGNSAGSGGGAQGGTLNNCTLTGNSADSGGGAFESTLNNCIVYYNSARYSSANCDPGSTLNYSCTTPLPASGTGNLADEPQLASAWRLSAGSPCIGRGSASYAGVVDLDGEPWANPPSIGCDEYRIGSVTGALRVAVAAAYTNVAVGFAVDFQAVIEGRAGMSRWDFGDGVVVSNRPWASHFWTTPGDYVVELRAYNESEPTGVATTVTVRVVHQEFYVALDNASPVPPYNSWANAATNIQDALDAVAVPGALVWVSNGVYQTGARAVYGTSNRVAVNQPVTVRSVNGPSVTSIVGSGPNGPAPVRCVYLTNGAVLSGFTLTNGATQMCEDAESSSIGNSGGGVWCESLSAVITNCVLAGNAGCFAGGGVWSGTLNNCTFMGNSSGYGGGACNSMLNNCTLAGNSGSLGGGVSGCTLNNCTLATNSADCGGGAYESTLNNCIVYYNSGANYCGGVVNYSCTTPLPDNGTGNISDEPQLTGGWHLSPTSPCYRAGSAAYASGVDVDGEPWANSPSIGCDEYWSGSLTGALSVAIVATYTNVRQGFALEFQAVIGGRGSASRWDFGDGLVANNRLHASHAWAAPGDYVVELRAYNETHPMGVATSVVVRVVEGMYYVAVASTNPVPPYTNWATAATRIQDAVDVAVINATIVVGDGVYQSGATAVYGVSNRVALTKSVTVQSVNGPAYTSIVGYQEPGTTNGPSAIRCVYLTNGAVLAGFTLTNGATSSYGGGVWCESDSAVVSNCALLGNSAGYHGGGAYFGTLNHCVLAGNSASGYGGGANGGTLNHCTLTGNSASQSGGGTYYSTLANCIVYDNTARAGGDNYAGGTLNYCCTTPLPAGGMGNISDEPQLAGNWHLSATSPCRGAGSAASTSGADLDGEPWANPPSIGCDEYWSGSVTGALSVAIVSSHTYVTPAFVVNFQAVIGGRVSASRWDFGDGTVTGNRLVVSHAWAVPGDYVVELRAYNETYPAGVAATVTVRVLAPPVHYVSAASANPVPPYTSWATAATRIQDAVDAAVPSAVILVSNGVYQTGARAVYGMSNRVALTKPVTVQSINGPASTSIVGYREPGTTNGPSAVRCAYLTNGAVLAGFTLTNGATQTSGDSLKNQSGGGVWCESASAVVNNCTLTGNSAVYAAGGAYYGTLSRCMLTGNSADFAGGALYSTLYHCTLTGNSAGQRGGGTYYGTLSQCMLTGNSAYAYGGGTYYGTLTHCTLAGNSAGFGGGAYYGTLNNCIVYYNSARHSNSNYFFSTLNYCCTTPGGFGNITDAPAFVDLAGGNLRLQSNSPCINAGNNTAVTTSTDLDGRPRIVGGVVDMGAYEYQGPGTGEFIGWLQQSGLPTDGSADDVDTDHDGHNNWQEWMAGTDPTNALSRLWLASPVVTPTNVILTWTSVINRTYTLEQATNLGGAPAFSVLRSNLVGQPGTTSWTDTNAPVSSPRFYQLRVSP